MFNAVLTEFLMISKDAFVALKVKLCEEKFRKKSEFLIQQTIFFRRSVCRQLKNFVAITQLITIFTKGCSPFFYRLISFFIQ